MVIKADAHIQCRQQNKAYDLQDADACILDLVNVF